MAIIKKFKKEFTMVPNEILNHCDLTLKSKGLWGYLASKPTDWNFSVKGCSFQNKDGLDAIRSGMKELEDQGYLKRVAHKNSSGQWDGYDYHIFDQPTKGESDDEKPVVGKSDDGEPPNLSNKDLSNKEKVILKETSLFSEDQIESIPKQVIRYLNQQKDSKKPFEFTSTNFGHIESRIKEGFKFEDFKTVIDFKTDEWKNNDKMKKYIRPETLFGSKFNGYLVASESHKPSNDGSNNFEYKPQEKAEML